MHATADASQTPVGQQIPEQDSSFERKPLLAKAEDLITEETRKIQIRTSKMDEAPQKSLSDLGKGSEKIPVF